MVTVGVDAHRRMLFVVVVDEQGQELQHWQIRNTARHWAEVLVQVEELCPAMPRQWGIEGSGHQGRGLAQLLVGQQEVVYEVNPRLTAQSRARSRRPDKSDHADALAIARVLVQEAGELPRIQPDDATTPLEILTRERQTLQADIIRNRNRLHAELVRIDPEYQRVLPKLTTLAGLDAILAWDDTRLGVSDRIQLQVVQRRAQRLRALMQDCETVSTQIRELSRPI